MRAARKRIQKGSLRQVPRAKGKWDWEFRYLDPTTGEHKSIYYSGELFPNEALMRQHLAPFLMRLNSVDSRMMILDPTVDDLLNQFIADENLGEIKARRPGERAVNRDELAYSTATSYLSLINRIRGKWGATKLDEFNPFAFQQWLKELKCKPKTRGHLKAFVSRLFNKAKLYGMLNFVENPIELVEVRGISKRSRKPISLTVEQFFLVLGLLPQPYWTMALTAQCTGLRVEEILALDWARIDFERLCMKVEEAVVHGRIGPVKSEYSDDELPLDPDFASVLLDWKRISNAGDSGLVFPSHITGKCYHASPLQQDWIRRAGWCLVACPECGAAPGEDCSGFQGTRRQRPQIHVHEGRRTAAMAAGFGSVGWHTFRHGYRTLLSGTGTPLEVQQTLMRHADISTTMQYGESPMENRRQANSQVVRKILVRRST